MCLFHLFISVRFGNFMLRTPDSLADVNLKGRRLLLSYRFYSFFLFFFNRVSSIDHLDVFFCLFFSRYR